MTDNLWTIGSFWIPPSPLASFRINWYEKFDSSLFLIGQCNETNISDGICDGSNNHLSCEYDGGDCCKPVIYVHKCEMNSTCYCHYWLPRRFSHFIEPFGYDPFTGYISSKSSSYSISNLTFKSKVCNTEGNYEGNTDPFCHHLLYVARPLC